MVERTGNRKRFAGVWLYERSDGVWEDEKGTTYALADPKLGSDSHNRAGVGVFSLPEDHFLSQAAPMHDYMFTSPHFQKMYTMTQANVMFLHNAAILSKGHRLARVWLWIARQALRQLGPMFWDNKETRR